MKRENFGLFNQVRDILNAEPFQKCTEEDSDEFEMLKNAGFEDWSEKNCFVFYYLKFFNKNCSFINVNGFSNNGRDFHVSMYKIFFQIKSTNKVSNDT